jgi:dipeptide/tripeptide permease
VSCYLLIPTFIPSLNKIGRVLLVMADPQYRAFSQMLNNFISQAGTMGNDSTPNNTSRVNLSFLLELHGIPNDILTNIDALTIIAFIPILNTCLYPILRRSGILFRPIARITVGFIFAGLAMLYAAGVQHLIYISVICEHMPLICFQFTNIGLLAPLLRFSSQLWRL